MPVPNVYASGGAEDGIHRDAPLLQQPFGDVDAIPIPFAPGAELARRCVHLWRETQMLNLQFEFGGDSRSGWNGKPPTGVAASAFEKDGC